jgi:tape measure domain-containing protein
MANGGFQAGSAWIEIGADLSKLGTNLSQAQQLTNAFAGSAQQAGQRASASLQQLNVSAQTASNQIQRLSASVQNQNQQLKINQQVLDAAKKANDDDSLAVQRAQLAVDRLTRSLALNQEMLGQAQTKAKGYQDAITQLASTGGGAAGGGLGQFGSALLSGFGIGTGYALVTQGVQAITGAITSATSSIISFDSQLEQSQIGWTTLLHGGTQATQMLKDLQTVAAATPFTFEGLQQSARYLIATGTAAQQVLPTLIDIGNVAAGLGVGEEGIAAITRAIGQMNTATKVHAQDMLQLTSVGVPAWEILAQATGHTTAEVQKLSEQGKITSDVFITAFREWSRQNFGTAMEGQAKTFQGAMSTITDSLKFAGGQAFQPLFESLSKLAVILAGIMQDQNFQYAVASVAKAVDLLVRGIGVLAGMYGIVFPDAAAAGTDALDKFKNTAIEATTAAQAQADTINGLKTELDAAKTKYQEYADAQIAGTKKYEDALNDFAIQQAEAQLALNQFQEAGGGLSMILDPLQQKIDGETQATADWADKVKDAENAVRAQEDAVKKTERSLRPYDDAIRSAEEAVRNQESAVRDAEQSLRPYDAAIRSAQDAISAQEGAVRDAEDAQKSYDQAVRDAQTNVDQQTSRLGALKDAYDAINDSLDEQKRKIDDLRNTPLAGEGALSDQLFALDQQIKQQQLAIYQAQDRGAGKDQIRRLQDQLDALRRQREEAQIRGDLTFDPQRRALEQQGVQRNEQSYQAVSDAIKQAQGNVDSLTQQLGPAKVAWDQANQAVSDAKWDLLDATGAARLHNEEVQTEKDKLDTLKLALDAAKQARDQQAIAIQGEKDKLDDLKVALDTSKHARDVQSIAIQAEKDKLDDLKGTLDTVKTTYDDHKTTLDQLKTAYQKAKDDALAPYEQQLKDIKTQTDDLKLKHEIAFGAMQHNIDEFVAKKKELTYDDILAGLKLWGDKVDALTAQYAALEAQAKLAGAAAATAANAAANMDGGTGDTSTFGGDSGTGAGAYNVQAIDDMLKGTGLEGQGANIARFAQQYHVPAALALAMFQKESSLLTAGSSVANNNPGNIVYTGGAYGEDRTGGRFGHYPSVEAGVEAYFKLLDREYRRYLDSGNIAGLITKYAPPSENDTAQYIRQITDWIKTIAAAITASTGTGAGTPLEQALAALGLSGAKITQGFNDMELVNGQMVRHGGIDIAGLPEGTPVNALQAGKVKWAGYSPDFGNIVEVQNAVTGQLEEYYGHLRDLNVKTGDMVAAGQQIGTLGHTGKYATGTHLHFQMYDENGNLVDPMEAIKMLFGSGAGVPDIVTAAMALMGLTNTAPSGTGAGTDAMTAMGAFTQMLAQAGGTAQGVYGNFQTLATLLQFLMQTVTQTGGALTDIAPTIPPIATGIDQVSAALDGLKQRSGTAGVAQAHASFTDLMRAPFPGDTPDLGPNVPSLVPDNAADLVRYYKELAATMPRVVVNAGALQGRFDLLGQTYDDLGPKIPAITDGLNQQADAMNAAANAAAGLQARTGTPGTPDVSANFRDLVSGTLGGAGRDGRPEQADASANFTDIMRTPFDGMATDLGPQIPAIFGKAATDGVSGFIDVWSRSSPDLVNAVNTSFQQVYSYINDDMVLAQNATEGAVGNILVFIKNAINAIGALNQAIQNVNSLHVDVPHSDVGGPTNGEPPRRRRDDGTDTGGNTTNHYTYNMSTRDNNDLIRRGRQKGIW